MCTHHDYVSVSVSVCVWVWVCVAPITLICAPVLFSFVGPLLTCKKGILDSPRKRKDVDKDFISLFTVLDENMSWLLDENIETYCKDPDTAKTLKEDEDFMEANKMHSINGYMYGNLPGLDLCLGDKVSWHLFGLGNEVDLHTGM